MIKKFEEFIEESYGNRSHSEIDEIDRLAIKYFGKRSLDRIKENKK